VSESAASVPNEKDTGNEAGTCFSVDPKDDGTAMRLTTSTTTTLRVKKADRLSSACGWPGQDGVVKKSR
jgi:hypothetical protein